MKTLNRSLERLIDGLEGFIETLRNIADEVPQQEEDFGDAGAGEEVCEHEDDLPRGAAPEGIDDNTVITMKSGDLREVVDAYRKLVRLAREGRIPTQEQRFKLHQSVRKVKHLIRKPRK